MTQVETLRELHNALAEWREKGLAYAFVPTMGALHAGHLRLVAEAQKRYGRVVVSIFVNPTQFDRPEDLAKYPRPIESDANKLYAAGTDILFVPSVGVIYPPDAVTPPMPDLDGLDTRYEGAMRPGHFAGVVQVVRRLIEMVAPTAMIMGQKDAQQVAVLRRAARAEVWPVEIIAVPTVRKASGLAMSSRNAQLSNRGLDEAASIYTVLQSALALWNEGHTAAFIALLCKRKLVKLGFEPEYFDLVSATDFLPVAGSDNCAEVGGSLLWITVAWYEGVRLIDNLPVDGPANPIGPRT